MDLSEAATHVVERFAVAEAYEEAAPSISWVGGEQARFHIRLNDVPEHLARFSGPHQLPLRAHSRFPETSEYL